MMTVESSVFMCEAFLGQADYSPEMPQDKLNKRHREEIDSDSGTEVDLFKSPFKKLRQTFIVEEKEIRAFFRLFDDPVISDFVTADGCKKVTDKYLLAMVFAYFKRASFKLREYNRTNFFLALYLANDMEEDEEDFKYEIFPWALGDNWKEFYMGFLRKREKLWIRMQYRSVVSKRCCDEVMSLRPEHWIWRRERPIHHSGAIRMYVRDPDDDGYPIGPNGTPRVCDDCLNLQEFDSASPSSASWYLSSSDESSPEFGRPAGVKSTRILTSRFDFKGLQQTLQEDSIWARQEEE